MTHRGIQDESETSAEQTKSMNGNSASVPAAGRGSDSTSPLPLSSEGRQAEEAASSTVLKMGSTDSAGNARGPSCGLVSSLLPSSCRGSAEAFARCLHRRLTSLGNENGSPERTADAAKPCETSWLHPSSSNRHVITNNLTVNNQHPILQHQPRHSPESDLFYDIEVEEAVVDGPGSPPEEATAAELAHLLVNPEILKASHHDACHCSPSGTKMTSGITGIHQDPESCVFASPITGTPPDSDSSEMFFDPESSDADKSKAEVYFDPISTSDSEATNLSNTPVPARTKLASNGRKRTDTNPERCEDTTSESSCSLRKNPASCENGCLQEGLVCSSEDSLNGRSSQETTSPSHESLWSTFDDSTVSLQDESPPRTIQDSVIPHICLPKSHSDSELPSNGISTVVFNKLDRRDEKEEEEVDKREIDEVDFVNGMSNNVMCDVRNGSLSVSTTQNVENDSDLTKNDSFNRAEDLVNMIEDKEKKDYIKSEFQTTPKSPSQLKVEEAASDTDTDHSSYSSTVDIPDAFSLEYSNNAIVTDETNPRNDPKLKIEKDTALNDNDEEKLCLLLKKFDGSSAAKEGDSSPEQETQSETAEEEVDRPQRVRRCSSLKTGKTPPGTPHRKKIVRFADKLGLDLADVRTFLDEIPKIPNSAYNDLIYDDIFRPQDCNSDNIASVSDNCCPRYQNDDRRRFTSVIPRKIDRMLMPLFQQPGGMSNFLDIVRERLVCLENVVVQDPVTLAIQGTVRVINLDFHKSVHVRYTLNSWRNFSDLQAIYVPNSCDGFSDKFSFILYCHTLLVGQRLEFAVRFQCKGVQHWDNNAGTNYCFQCLPASSSTGYIPITADECRRWSPMFY